jgi:RimJ/RimL family protein N-acetyltransferase
MSAPPKTVLQASPEEELSIRAAVAKPDLTALGEGFVVASAEHVAPLMDFLADPAVSDPIYDLPRPLSHETIAAWVREAELKQRAGESLLVIGVDADGRVFSYSKFSVWPERASGEMAGAVRADRQNSGGGKVGAARSFGWMFETLGVRLIGLTAALENLRSARVIEAAGFSPMGERACTRADGAIRISRYWEMTREAWRTRHGR